MLYLWVHFHVLLRGHIKGTLKKVAYTLKMMTRFGEFAVRYKDQAKDRPSSCTTVVTRKVLPQHTPLSDEFQPYYHRMSYYTRYYIQGTRRL